MSLNIWFHSAGGSTRIWAASRFSVPFPASILSRLDQEPGIVQVIEDLALIVRKGESVHGIQNHIVLARFQVETVKF